LALEVEPGVTELLWAVMALWAPGTPGKIVFLAIFQFFTHILYLLNTIMQYHTVAIQVFWRLSRFVSISVADCLDLSRDKSRQIKTNQDKSRQVETIYDRKSRQKTNRDKSRQIKTNQDKSRQVETSQDKSRQSATEVETNPDKDNFVGEQPKKTTERMGSGGTTTAAVASPSSKTIPPYVSILFVAFIL
jgi:hypothetical protein